MRTLRKTLLLTMTLVLSLSVILAGCGSSSGSGGKDGKVEISWMVTSNPAKQPWYEQTVKDFEAKYPNIKVKLMTFPYAQIDQKIQTMISGKNMADVWSSNWSEAGFATFNQLGILLDMTPYLEKEPDVVKGIDPRLLDIYKVDGKTYGLPMLNYGTFLFYNKDLLDAAGLPYPTTDWEDQSWNWDKMVEYGTKLTDKSKQQYGLLYDDTANKRAWLFGGDFFSEDAYKTGNMGEPQILNNPKIVEAIQKNADLVLKHKISPNPAQTEAMNQLGNPFMTGKVAMMIGGGWGFQNFKQAEFRWGAAALPNVEGRQISLYVDPWNIYKNTKHPDEAWTFVKFLMDPKGAAKTYAENTGATPVYEELLDNWYVDIAKAMEMKPEEVKQLNEGVIKYGRESDNHLIAKFDSILKTTNQTMSAIYNGTKSVEDGLKNIDSNLRSLNLK
ncbi:ABC transporter substrate-binding protein [Paenibacillus apiarius]|uniref:Sugar ABC transporter substrate-binding protein n=5 Tax=Paenibacillus apiarius TaxID=46240 RepID=A0ABT4DQL2_9BACL|nr:sugar ABC transporter substrate-binding protein [Paenibacillus apiarius]MCY9518326.1 sugar ABC transporter substrate-binding protein [Paenibacillus apiarius]MCY9551273.1 sugar ABC transporter substrate-binding protein [Paenibacillus apiarius]MCY9558427.1 sugar ABC transporter substrate-binding protein [Paenibacillus apiarius]MCY9721489.1 sugar ABC transporter substrate-binding protein [Paenibacillus apiarius]MCY9728254.1 sugar ABC transporter substrate-binding protein [Paenibacillus apiariu